MARPEAALELSRKRLAAQLLVGDAARDPVAVAERLLAIQAQDERGFRLAIRARSAGLTAADVDRALSIDRSLVVGWLNRGTLHLVRREDYGWLHSLTTPPLLTGTARRLAQEGVSPRAAERGVDVIERALGGEGPLTRAQLRGRLEAAGVRTEGQALVHVLALAAHRGMIVRGPVLDDGHQAFVLVRDWIGLDAQAAVDRERALAELARRYLAGHGPADERDLARWAGLPVRDARAGLKAVETELVHGSEGRVELASNGDGVGQLARSRLLGAFDPVLLGWRSREWVTGPHDSRIVSGGVFRPFALVDGVAAGIWRITAGRVDIESFADPSRRDVAALQADGRDMLRFLGLRDVGG